MCQLEKPRANEITEPLAFTVCKLKLRGKAIVLQSRSRRTRFNHQLYMGKTKRKRCPSSKQKQTEEQVPRGFKETHVLALVNKGQNKTKPRRKCRSVGSKIQGGIRFVQ